MTQIPKTTNAHYVEERNGRVLLFSYKTIVAVHIQYEEFVKLLG